MDYFVGDIQGCCDALERLLRQLDFSASRDHLYVLGDMVNRGPQSLQTLQRLRALEASATCLLGNHDLHLLAVAEGLRVAHRSDTLHPILAAPDRDAWIAWVAQRPLAVQAGPWLLVHAGVPPQWDAAQTLVLSAEVEAALRSPERHEFLRTMYGNDPSRWDDELQGAQRSRFVINALTRMRFCTADGTLDLKLKDSAASAPPGFMPWFDVPGRRSADTPIAFGHWSTLGLLNRDKLLGLDTGCVWGGQLTAARIDGLHREIVQVPCKQAQKPG